MSEPRYKIDSTGNGATFTITRLADGKSVFLQGDDAKTFGDALIGTEIDGDSEAEVCAQYDDVMA